MARHICSVSVLLCLGNSVCVYFFYLRRYVQERGRPINLSAAVCCQIKSEKLKITILHMFYPTPTIFDRRQWAQSLTLYVSLDILIFASMDEVFWVFLRHVDLFASFLD